MEEIDGYDNAMMFRKCYDVLMEQTDVQFIFNVGSDVIRIPANKIVLNASSPVFNAMFNNASHPIDVNINDASPAEFKAFLQLFYGDHTKLTKENIAVVLMLIYKYKAIDSLSNCIQFLKNNLTVDDVLWGLHLAIKFNIVELKSHCITLIQSNCKNVLKKFHLDKNGQLNMSSWNYYSEIELENVLAHVIIALKGIL